MKRVLLLFALASLCVPTLVQAQFETCWGCTLGVFDGEDLKQNYGTWDTGVSPQKKFYLGIKYDPTSTYDGLSGIEFSIDGLPSSPLEPNSVIRDGGIKLGMTIKTPPDTTVVGAEGGWNVIWTDCRPGNRVVVEITMISLDVIPNNTVIRVRRKFPPTDDETPHAFFTMCNTPFFTKVRATNGCYVLNPTGADVGCDLAVAITPTTWTTVKELYR